MPTLTRFAALALFTLACAQPTNGRGGDDEIPPPGGAQTGTQEGDWAAILRLESEAKAVARTSGCSSVTGCRTAPVGSRACGGPRYYIPYCAASTDSAALFRKLAEVASAEREFNRKYQIGSTCEYRMPAPLTISGGECRMVTQ